MRRGQLAMTLVQQIERLHDLPQWAVGERERFIGEAKRRGHADRDVAAVLRITPERVRQIRRARYGRTLETDVWS